MKSVGEAMSIGRTFKEALQKGLRSLEIKKSGLVSIMFKDAAGINPDSAVMEQLHEKLRVPNAERIFYIGDALRIGMDIDRIYDMTRIDKWFLFNIKEIIECERAVISAGQNISRELLARAKAYGFSDSQLGALLHKPEEEIAALRKSFNIKVSYKLVDTCAAEFKAATPYFYSTYEQ